MTNIAFCDVETTGLDPKKDSLLEIAVLVTDENLNVLDDEGYQAVVYYERDVADWLRKKASPFVQEMHARTGLWDRIDGGKPLHVIDLELRQYLARFNTPGNLGMPFGGNSVRLDMNFVERYLPSAFTEWDYHARDVSSIAGFMSDWFGTPPLEKASDHTAMTDIRECIREARYYQGILDRRSER